MKIVAIQSINAHVGVLTAVKPLVANVASELTKQLEANLSTGDQYSLWVSK